MHNDRIVKIMVYLKNPNCGSKKMPQQCKNNLVKIWGGQICAKRTFMFKKKTALLKKNVLIENKNKCVYRSISLFFTS
jgi:hypothetical protein